MKLTGCWTWDLSHRFVASSNRIPCPPVTTGRLWCSLPPSPRKYRWLSCFVVCDVIIKKTGWLLQDKLTTFKFILGCINFSYHLEWSLLTRSKEHGLASHKTSCYIYTYRTVPVPSLCMSIISFGFIAIKLYFMWAENVVRNFTHSLKKNGEWVSKLYIYFSPICSFKSEPICCVHWPKEIAFLFLLVLTQVMTKYEESLRIWQLHIWHDAERSLDH